MEREIFKNKSINISTKGSHSIFRIIFIHIQFKLFKSTMGFFMIFAINITLIQITQINKNILKHSCMLTII